MSTPTQSATSPVFLTEDLPFAAYLHATRKLRFLTCQVNGTDRVAFVFADPNQEGNQLHLDFESGAECAAVSLYDSIRHLRRVMDGTRTRSNEQNEQHTHRR
ncbi:MAG TPA: hypothetical protein VNY24_15315 [Candidatus Acidoferrales bacterium]|jgi:hypothetical protein|nr:hypothetical protein [Candidatus Acidoferrales bacterium]